jgi:hypothetical protein
MQDGEYDLNRSCMDAYKNHGVTCTFDIQWDTPFANNSKQDYLDWQADGFEIATHSSEAVGTQSGSGTDEEVIAIVKNSYSTLIGYGFDVKSFVSLQGNTRPVAYPIIKRYYECGFCKTNHRATDTPLLTITNDPPYELWRYSLEDSTDQQALDAVNTCIANTGLVIFYWHARSNNSLYSIARLNALLDYITSKDEIQVLNAYNAIADYYAIRREDL